MLTSLLPRYTFILQQKEYKRLVYETLWMLINLTACKEGSDGYQKEFIAGAEKCRLFEVLIGKIVKITVIAFILISELGVI
jgi:hypothetical protein